MHTSYFVRLDFGPLVQSMYLASHAMDNLDSENLFLAWNEGPVTAKNIIAFSDAGDAVLLASTINDVINESSYPTLHPNMRNIVDVYLAAKKKHSSENFKFQICVEMQQTIDISTWGQEE